MKGLQIQRKTTENHPSDMWLNWDWAGNLKPQIDLAVAQGANCLKISGGTRSVVDGRQSRASLHANIAQFIEYAAANGCYVYWSSHFPEEDLNASHAATLAEIVSMMALVDSYPNVIGNDCSNEAVMILGESQAATNQTAFYNAIKAVAPTLPLSVSLVPGNASQWSDHLAALATHVDFWDMHPYYGSGDPAPGDLARLRSSAYYKRWFIGECGQQLAAGGTAQTNRWTALGVLSAESDCAGAVGYTTQDCTGIPGYSADYGMYSPGASPTERTQISTPFHAWPTT